jgi:hypothetical protein
MGSRNRVKLLFTPGLDVEFTDRGRAIQQVEEIAGEGTRFPIVVFGPEGCGKTAWLKQSVEVLKELGFDVIYIDPVRKDYVAYTDVRGIVDRLSEAAAEAIGIAQVKLATLAIDLVKELLSRWGKRRIAILVDDVFQAIGLDKAEIYVKSLLGLIEYPPASYEKIIAVVVTSEGITREGIGRHRWAELRAMWNMSREGFEELYEQIRKRTSGSIPGFEDVWMLTGGNPGMLAQLYRASWDINAVTTTLIEDRKLTSSFINKWRHWLEEAIRDPDILWSADTPEELVNELKARNLIIYNMHSRIKIRWIDQPPPERDPELGISRYAAWQTPLHREAVRRAVEEYK